jgi:hypothetical protein
VESVVTAPKEVVMTVANVALVNKENQELIDLLLLHTKSK